MAAEVSVVGWVTASMQSWLPFIVPRGKVSRSLGDCVSRMSDVVYWRGYEYMTCGSVTILRPGVPLGSRFY
jgi:hypothetical protein